MASTDPQDEALRALADRGITLITSDREAAEKIRVRLQQRTPEAAAWPRRWSLGRRSLALALLGLVASGTAAAAVVSLATRDSAPARGPIPAVDAHHASPGDYAVRVEPDLRVGHTGWCLTVTASHTGTVNTGATGCGPAAVGERPLVAAGAVMTSNPAERSIAYIVVNSTVAAVRSGGERVIPHADDALPSGWRIAILTPQGSPTDAFDYQLEATDGRILTPREIAGTTAATYPTVSGRADANDAQPCAIGLHGDDNAATSAKRIRGPLRPTPDLEGRPLLSCAAVDVTGAHGTVTVTLLLDAADPSGPAAELPGAQPIPSSAGLVRLDAMTAARRDGRAWLVARGENLDDAIEILGRAFAH